MSRFGIFGKAVEGLLKYPATRHGVEDASPAAMLRSATEVQKKVNQEVERIQATAPKAVDPTELLERQVSDAAESMRRLDDEAWEVGVSVAASKDAFANSTPEFTELEQALATPRHADPIPVDPIADAELKKMLNTPTGTIEANNLYLDPAAMKEWQTRLLQKHIDARTLQAQEKLDTPMQVGACDRRAGQIKQAADDLNLQAMKRSDASWGNPLFPDSPYAERPQGLTVSGWGTKT